MNPIKLSIILLFLALNICYQVVAQNPISEDLLKRVQQPSPEAAQLGKFGDVPVGLNTGTPQIDIPLYTIKGNEISLPISISYHASGLKVKEEASWVGLGWVLNAGGVITRYVHGRPDADASGGYFSDYNYWLDIKDEPYDKVYGDPGAQFRVQAATGFRDLEPDEFVFNFAGYSGRIKFTHNQEPVIFPYKDLKIEVGSGFSSFTITNINGTKYIFDQVEYSNFKFGGNYPSSWYLSSIESANGTEIIRLEYTLSANSWQEEVIDYPLSTEVNSRHIPSEESNCVVVDYPTSEIETSRMRYLNDIYFDKYNLQVSFNSQTDRQDIGSGNTSRRLESILVTRYDGEVISNIQFDNNHYFVGSDPVEFDYLNKRLKLNKVQKLLKDEEYSFQYNSTAMPSYISKNVDHWGYYNDAGNTSIIPSLDEETIFYSEPNTWTTANREPNAESMKACILERITYPTGGYTSFEYEPHKQCIEDLQKNELKHYLSRTDGGVNNMMTPLEQQFKDFYDDGDNPYPPPNVNIEPFVVKDPRSFALSTVSQNTGGITEGYRKVYLYKMNYTGDLPDVISDLVLSTYIPEPFDVMNDPNSEELSYGLEEQISLEPDIYLIFTMVTENLSGLYIQGEVQFLENTTIPYEVRTIGGLRIKRLTDYDPVSEESIIKQYAYVYNYGDALPPDAPANYENSSLKLFENPYDEISDYDFDAHCSTKKTITSYMVNENGNPIDNKGSHIGYDEVSVIQNNGNNGFTTYKYKNGNRSEFRNYLEEKVILDKDYELVKKVKNQYSDGEFYLSSQPVYTTKINLTYAKKPCGDGLCDIEYDFMKTEHSETSYWLGLKQKQVQLYNDVGNDFVTTTTYYSYDGADMGKHNLPSEIRTVNSDDNEKIVRRKYPADYGFDACADGDIACEDAILVSAEPEVQAIFNMQRAHKKSPIIEETIYKKDLNDPDQLVLFVSSTLNNYSINALGNALPMETLEVQREVLNESFEPSSVNNSGQLVRDVLYDDPINEFSYSFDVNANLTGYNHNGKRKAFLWDPNGRYLIAEIENANAGDFFYTSFDGMGSIADNARTEPDYYPNATFDPSSYFVASDNSLEYLISYWYYDDGWKFSGEMDYNGEVINTGDRYDDVRIYPKGSLMKTYTYDPLIGIASITDEKNITTFYDYDDESLRLKYIKNHEGFVIERYEYNYHE